MYCTKCGQNNNDGASFCISCGSPMINIDQYQNAQIKSSTTSKKNVKDGFFKRLLIRKINEIKSKDAIELLASMFVSAFVLFFCVFILRSIFTVVGLGADYPKDIGNAYVECLKNNSTDYLKSYFPRFSWKDCEYELEEDLRETRDFIKDAGFDVNWNDVKFDFNSESNELTVTFYPKESSGENSISDTRCFYKTIPLKESMYNHKWFWSTSNFL